MRQIYISNSFIRCTKGCRLLPSKLPWSPCLDTTLMIMMKEKLVLLVVDINHYNIPGPRTTVTSTVQLSLDHLYNAFELELVARRLSDDG